MVYLFPMCIWVLKPAGRTLFGKICCLISSIALLGIAGDSILLAICSIIGSNIKRLFQNSFIELFRSYMT